MVCTCTEFAERYNFAAGPAMLPAEVLTQIREEMPDWRGSGSSILEQPFTSAAFKGLMEEVEADLRTLLSIPGAIACVVPAGRSQCGVRCCRSTCCIQGRAPTTRKVGTGHAGRSVRLVDTLG